MADVSIKNAPQVINITGAEKLPVSDGSGSPKSITINQINDQVKIKVIQHSENEATIAPNIFHIWGEVEELSINLETPTDETIYNEYMFEFKSGSVPTSLILPSDISWIQEPLIQKNSIYQCSIVNNLAIIIGSCIKEE